MCYGMYATAYPRPARSSLWVSATTPGSACSVRAHVLPEARVWITTCLLLSICRSTPLGDCGGQDRRCVDLVGFRLELDRWRPLVLSGLISSASDGRIPRTASQRAGSPREFHTSGRSPIPILWCRYFRADGFLWSVAHVAGRERCNLHDLR